MCYMVPVGRGVTHEYQDMFERFTCCVGTGMENHALLGYGIYYESGGKLWENLYTPATAEWKKMGAKLDVQTDFPEGGSVKMNISVQSPRQFTLALRRPQWAGGGFSVAVNGRPISDVLPPGNYIELARTWKNGDTVELNLSKQLDEDPLPDNSHRVALRWGPLVLAGDLGPEDTHVGRSDKLSVVPVFVTDDTNVVDWGKPIPGKPGEFRTGGMGRERDVDLIPFYRLSERTYAVYWDLYTQEEWEQKAWEIAVESAHQRKLELATEAYASRGKRSRKGISTNRARIRSRTASWAGRHAGAASGSRLTCRSNRRIRWPW